MMAKVGRGILLRSFLVPFSKSELNPVLGDVVDWKSRDTNMTSSEIERMRALL